MEITTVCVIGGGGFVGRHICHQLAARGYRVCVPTRDPERAKQLILLPTVEVVAADVHDAAALSRVVRGADAVINLVGVLHEGRGRASFREAHVGLPRKIIAACRQHGVRRLLHMSALNAGAGAPSAYLRSKGEAEAIARESGLEVTLFRPSVVFGRDDTFLNLFAMLPAVADGGAGQPERAFPAGIRRGCCGGFCQKPEDIGSFGKSYDLCGPRVYTLRELVEFAGIATGHARPIIGLNDTLSYWQVFAMEPLPVKLMTRDNYYLMKLDSVCNCDFPFDIRPAALEAVAPLWLKPETLPRTRYQRFRNRAGR